MQCLGTFIEEQRIIAVCCDGKALISVPLTKSSMTLAKTYCMCKSKVTKRLKFLSLTNASMKNCLSIYPALKNWKFWGTSKLSVSRDDFLTRTANLVISCHCLIVHVRQKVSKWWKKVHLLGMQHMLKSLFVRIKYANYLRHFHMARTNRANISHLAIRRFANRPFATKKCSFP